MSRGIAIIIYTCSGLLAAVSQMLLKIAAEKNKEASGIRRLLNIRVIISYLMLLCTIFMNMIAMRYMPYKYTPVLATISYVFVMLLSYFVLRERISKKQVIGMVMIFTGIVVFNLSLFVVVK